MYYRWNVILLQAVAIAACDVTAPSGGGFETQVSRLVADVSMSPERLRALDRVLSAVEHSLDAVWPGCKAVVFGSVSFGLAFKTSDLDISVTLPSEIDHSTLDQSQRVNLSETLDQSSNEYGRLVRAKAALDGEPRLYRDVRIITVTRVPIIVLHFIPASVRCDIVLQKNTAAFSGELIHFLLYSDQRVIKLATVVKQWGRATAVTGSRRLSNYALTLMVIFYLQRQRVLPSVEKLQRNTPPVIVTGFDYSNVAFERRIPAATNNASLYALLGGFFEYYEEFDFKKFVVCPYLGSPVERTMFGSVATVPEVFSLYKTSVSNNDVRPLDVSTALCVQDPLVHSNSCAGRVDDVILSIIKDRVHLAARLYRERHRDDFLDAIMTL